MKLTRSVIPVAIILTATIFLTQSLYAAVKYDTAYKDAVFKQVIPTHILAVIKEDCSLSAEPSLYSKTVKELKKGVTVEILQDSSEKWYKVESSDEDAIGWISAKYIEISDVIEDAPPGMFDEDIEAFANIMNFPTKTDYLIWTDVARQLTHVLKKSDNTGGFTLIKTFICATGKNTAPTTRGYFTINSRGKWFYSKRFKSGAMYWVRFNGTYLFHSVAMDKNKKVIDGILGERRSNGCVRLSVNDARWLYENIPDGTSVFIH